MRFRRGQNNIKKSLHSGNNIIKAFEQLIPDMVRNIACGNGSQGTAESQIESRTRAFRLLGFKHYQGMSEMDLTYLI